MLMMKAYNNKSDQTFMFSSHIKSQILDFPRQNADCGDKKKEEIYSIY